MLSSHSTVFGIYSRRALMTMICRIFELLESLPFFLYHHQLELASYFVVVLFSWWFLNAQGDSPTTSEQEKNEYSIGKSESGSVQVNDSFKQAVCFCQTLPVQPSLREAPIPRVNSDFSLSQAALRNIQPKTSFLELRLNDISNRSLKDSIWATPTKTSIESDKTPTQKSYSQNIMGAKLIQVQRGSSLNEDEFCLNHAVRTETPNLEEKKVFERKNMGISPWLNYSLRTSKNGSRVRRDRSFPRLRHSVLTWWAGVEQEQVIGQEPPMEPQIQSDFEDNNRSAYEVIQPWDSCSTAAHNFRSVNDQNNTKTRMGRFFTNFDPATMVSRTHDISE